MGYKDIFDMLCRVVQLVSAMLRVIGAIRRLQDGRKFQLKNIDADRILAGAILCVFFIVPVAISEVQIIICLIKK